MAVTSTTAAAGTASGASTGAALGSLSGNFQDFLKLLMTQLRNQDPASPMDTNQFTSQLVQYANVEQQINANTNLTKLIQATQDNGLLQSAGLVGKQVEVASDQVPLQSGRGALRFTTAAPEAVSIGIYSETGAKLRDAQVTSTAGVNNWSWDGKDDAGNAVPAGAYRVVVMGASGTALPFTALGTVTGVQRTNGTVQVELGSLRTAMGTVQSVVSD